MPPAGFFFGFRKVYEATFDEALVWQVYPPYVLFYRSITFMLIIIVVAELCGRWHALLQPRNVPTVRQLFDHFLTILDHCLRPFQLYTPPF